MFIGYSRTSTTEQIAGLEAQDRELKAAGAERIFTEQVSSVAPRKVLEEAIDYAREGDVLCVTKLESRRRRRRKARDRGLRPSPFGPGSRVLLRIDLQPRYAVGHRKTVRTIFDDNSASKFPSRVLFNEPYVLAVPDGHRFAQRRNVKLSDLRGEPFIVRARCDRYHDVSDALESRAVTLKVMYKTDQDDRAPALVAAGVGLALFPAHFEMPAVKKVAVSDLGLSRAIGLLWSREREYDLKEFITFAECHCWTL
jgi:LysR substrate binding domain/Resolvase, N terminal domain